MNHFSFLVLNPDSNLLLEYPVFQGLQEKNSLGALANELELLLQRMENFEAVGQWMVAGPIEHARKVVVALVVVFS